MAYPDQGSEGQETQRTIELGPSGEQMVAQEAGRQGGQDEDDQDTQGMVSDQESPQAVMGQEEPRMQEQDEGVTLPPGQGEENDPLPAHQDEQTPGSVLSDQPEREEVPVSFEPLGTEGA